MFLLKRLLLLPLLLVSAMSPFHRLPTYHSFLVLQNLISGRLASLSLSLSPLSLSPLSLSFSCLEASQPRRSSTQLTDII